MSRHWNVKGLLALHALALGLMVLWSWPTSRTVLEGMSLSLFLWLNGSLADAPLWAKAVAISNVRAVDLVTAALMAVFLLKADWAVDRRQVREVFTGFVLLLIWLLIFREMVLSPLSQWAGWKLPSPSMAVDDAISLASHVGPFRVKSGDHTSFPGDHAAVLMAWWGYLLWMGRRQRRWRWLIPASALVIVMMLPRLIIGAHWLTDNLIGGTVIAALSLAWVCMTPLLAVTYGWIKSPLERSVVWINQRWPATRRLALLDAGDER